MAFLIIGVLLFGLKMAAIGPVATLSWGWVLLPFGLAAVWWAISDSIGLTQRRAINKMEDRKVKRRAAHMEALGLNTRREKRGQAIREARRRSLSQDERAGLSPDTNEDGRRR